MKYTYSITFYYSPKGSLACKEGGKINESLTHREKSKKKKKENTNKMKIIDNKSKYTNRFNRLN